MTKFLEECLKQIEKKYQVGEEFKEEDISPRMFNRVRYNLDRLVENGKLKRRTEFYERTLNVVIYYCR